MAIVCAKIHHYHCKGKYLKARKTPAAGMRIWMAALRYSIKEIVESPQNPRKSLA